MKVRYGHPVLLFLLASSMYVSCSRADEVDDHIRGLKAANGTVCRMAAEALGRLKDPRAVEPLITALKDDDWDARVAATEALGQLKDPRAVEPLIAALKESAKDDVWSGGWQVRVAAIKALGQIEDPRAVEPLIVALKESAKGDGWSGNWQVRVAAIKALGQIEDPRAVEPLITALKDEDSDTCKTAAKALVTLGAPSVEPLIVLLRDRNPRVRIAAARLLGQLKDARAVERLAVAFKYTDDGELLEAAAEALAGIGTPAVDALLSALEYGDSSVRRAAAWALGKIGAARAVEPLIALLKDSDSKEAHTEAARALGQLKDARAVQPLIAVLQNSVKDGGFLVRIDATTALVAIGAASVEPLIAALKAKESEVRDAAADALGRLKDARAVGPLISLLKDDESEVRATAADALGQIKNARAVEPLVALLGDSDVVVCCRAAEAMGRIKDARTVEPLSALLQDSRRGVRRAAAAALGEIGGQRAVRALVTALPDWEAQGRIGAALDGLGWKPSSAREKTYLWICSQNARELTRDWEQAHRILLEDIRSQDQRRRDNATFTFIALGREEMVPELITILEERGNAVMAAAYAHCWHDMLAAAARAWAGRHGGATPSDSHPFPSWGGWR